MLDYKTIIIRHYACGLTGSEIARQLGVSKSGVNDFLSNFKKCSTLSYPLPDGITNVGISEHVYGYTASAGGRDPSYEYPDYQEVHRQLNERKNMTLTYLWNRYVNRCKNENVKYYQFTQFCDLYALWCDENYETLHITSVPGQKMEVDFAGHMFQLTDKITGEVVPIVVFVAILPYSQYIYAEGMTSTKEPQWIEVNNHALSFFEGVPPIVVCDNCKQAVIANKDWINPDLNRDYSEWAEHNHTVILPAKVRKPKYKSSVENAVGILEKGCFHDLDELPYFSLAQFNEILHQKIDELNRAPFKNKEHNRFYYWEEEKKELLPLPQDEYVYMERKIVKVSGDYHIRFDNAYYSVNKAYVHKQVTVAATSDEVKIFAPNGDLIGVWERATRHGEWKTNPENLPSNYKEMSEWNGPYFISKAMTVGPNTRDVVESILKSKKYEVQTYRLCLGVLNFTKSYSKQALEECCKAAVEAGKPTYSYVKNTIHNIAETLGTAGFNTKINEEKNRGAFVMDSKASDLQYLLNKSESLIQSHKKEAESNEN